MRNILLGSLLVLSSCDFIFQTKEAAPDDAGSVVTKLEVTSLLPANGSDIGGYPVKFTGHGFKPAMGTGIRPAVTFNGVAAQCSAEFSDTELTCTVPSLLGVSGEVKVSITNELMASVMTPFLLPTDTSPFAVLDFPLPAQLVGAGVSFVGTGDWNGDRLTDILVMGRSEVFVCYGDGAASVPIKCDTISYAGGPAGKAAIGDINGDGISDLAYLQNGSVQIQVMSTNKPLSFAKKFPFNSAYNIGDFAFADLDADGKSDLAIAMSTAPSDGKVEVYTHIDPTPSAPAATVNLTGSAGAEVSVTAGKGKGNGLNDLLITWAYQGNKKYDLRRWDNVSTFASTGGTLFNGTITLPVYANLNGDGAGDAAFVKFDTKDIFLATGKPLAFGLNTPTVVNSSPLSTIAIQPLTAVSLAPSVVDGTPADLLVSYLSPGMPFDIYMNPAGRGTGAQSWPAPVQVPHPFASPLVPLVASADFNRDGANDLVVVGQNNGEVKLLLNRKRLQ